DCAKMGGWGASKGAAKGASKGGFVLPVQKPFLKQAAPVISAWSSGKASAGKGYVPKGAPKGYGKAAPAFSVSAPVSSWGKGKTTTVVYGAPSKGFKGDAKGSFKGDTKGSFKGDSAKGSCVFQADTKGSFKGDFKGGFKGGFKGDFKGGFKGDFKGGFKGDFKGKGKGKQGVPPANSEFWTVKQSSENREVMGGSFTGSFASYNMKFGWGFIVPDNVEELPAEAQEKIAEANAAATAAGKTGENMLYFRKPDIVEGCKAEKDLPCTFSIYIDDKGAGACDVSC
ncbi:unnamed protein product, partial [Polarella glacialis]